jgi:tetraacyldisaccharide 4'-kinase
MQLPHAPRFWWRRHSLFGYALAPFGLAYGRISGRRMIGTGTAIDIPVICIGNLVLGGAGKTPTALAIAKVCRQLGLEPGFLSRGYRGTQSGPLIVSTTLHNAGAVGDEPLLLAQHAPTVVAVDRVAGAKLLASLGVEVVLMDDGFQNPSLVKDLSLLVIDAERGIGNGLVFPAGPLRAPLAGQMRHADALVVLGEGSGGKGVRLAARAGIPILRAQREIIRRRGLKRRPYLAFAGIGEPAKFFATLAAAGAELGHTMSFPDHHPFSDAECEAILAEARHRELVPITTEKDKARLAGRTGAAERLAAATEVLPIRIRFEEPRRLTALISDAVAAHAGAYRRGARLSVGAATVPA